MGEEPQQPAPPPRADDRRRRRARRGLQERGVVRAQRPARHRRATPAPASRRGRRARLASRAPEPARSAQSRAYALGLVLTRDPLAARHRPLLPRLHRRRRDGAVHARAGAAAAGGRRRPEQRGRPLRAPRQERARRRRLPHRPALRRPARSRCAWSSACPPSRIGRPDQPEPVPGGLPGRRRRRRRRRAPPRRARPRADRPRRGPARRCCTARAAAHAWERAMRELGLEPELLEIADFTAAGGVAATRALLDRRDAAHRDRLRQRRDGDRRARRRPGPRPHPRRTSSRSSATTTPSWPPTSTRPSPPSAPTPSAGAAPRPGSCWIRSTAPSPTSSWPRPASWSATPPHPLATGRSHETHRHHTVPAVRRLAVAGCGGGGSEDADKAAAAKRPDQDLVLEQQGGGGLGQGGRREVERGATRRRRSPGRRSPPARPPRRSSAPSITAGNAPCLIFNTSPAAVPQFQKQGGLVALDTLPGGKEYVEERSGDAAEQYQSEDGKYYQLPWKANPVMIFYNRKLLKKAGIDAKNPPLATYDEFLATVAQDRLEQGRGRRHLAVPGVAVLPVVVRLLPALHRRERRQGDDGGRQGPVRRRGGPEGRRLLAEDVHREARRRTRSSTATPSASRRPPCRSSARGRSRSTARTSTGAPRRSRPRPASRPVRSRPSATRSRRPCTRACKNRGTAWEFLKFATSKEQDGALLEATGQMPMRPDLVDGLPGLLREEPGLQAVRRAGRPHRRGAERVELDRDLADLARRLLALGDLRQGGPEDGARGRRRRRPTSWPRRQ